MWAGVGRLLSLVAGRERDHIGGARDFFDYATAGPKPPSLQSHLFATPVTKRRKGHTTPRQYTDFSPHGSRCMPDGIVESQHSIVSGR